MIIKNELLCRQSSGDVLVINEPLSIVDSCTLLDNAPDDEAHQDAIQLIPPSRKGVFNLQFAGALLRHVGIANNIIHSTGQLQGIFCSDGLLADIIVLDNLICTASQHKVSLGGLLSGKVANNQDCTGLCRVQLDPLRIGGNITGRNVWVVGFSNADALDYDPLDAICLDDDLGHVFDYRRGHAAPRNGDCYLTDFDYDAFYDAASNKQHSPAELQQLALNFGTQTYPV